MKRIYVAGKLSDGHIEYVKHLHRMLIWAEKIRKLGFAVFIPGLDFLSGVVIGDLNYSDYFNGSQPWLDVSDAVFLVPGWESSEGTKKEIERATKQGIPLYRELETLAKELGDLR